MASMKVAISLPDPLFSKAEGLAMAMGKPRSQLYADALAEYLTRHSEHAITQQFNAVYQACPSEVEPVLMSAQRRVFDDEAW